jgi:hypothetical protein
MSETMLFVEELSANEAQSRMLEGFTVAKTVRELKQTIAHEIGQPRAWASIQVVFAGAVMEDCELILSPDTLAPLELTIGSKQGAVVV